MTNLIGHSLGRYHILEQLGQGGMATVYKAYDTRLERDVAVKVLRTDRFAPADLERILKRFEREAKALARLTHPNIVPVIDYGEHEGAPYLVMPYLPGGTLKQRLKDLGRPMPWQEALRLLLPIARALDYAHRQNILHRDVKPSNILITADGEPMLTDFGIAKILDLEDGQTLTATGVGVGTPEYMSPEQGLGKGVDARADVYSLGVVLYEMVTGRKPFQADTPIAVVVKHLNDPLPRPAQFAPDLPEAVEKILLKALAKKPEDRYASMAEFAAAMEKTVISGQSSVVSPSPLPVGEGPEMRAHSPLPVGEGPGVRDDAATIDQPITGETMLQDEDRRPPSPVRRPRSKLWLPLGLLVLLLGASVALGLGLITLGMRGMGPLAGLAIPTRTPNPMRIHTPTPTFTTVMSPSPFTYPIPTEDLTITPTNSSTGCCTLSLEGSYSLESVNDAWAHISFSRNLDLVLEVWGKTPFYIYSRKNLKIWDLHSGQEIFSIRDPDHAIYFASLLPSNHLFILLYDRANIYDIRTGSILDTYYDITSHRFLMEIPENGGYFATTEYHSYRLNLWDRTNDSILYTLETISPIEKIVFSPDNSMLAVSQMEKQLQLWQIPTGNLLHLWNLDLDNRYNNLGFSADGNFLSVITNSSYYGGSLYVLQISDGSVILEKDFDTDYDAGFAFSPIGEGFVWWASGHAEMWNLENQQLVYTLEGQDITFSPDGTLFSSKSSNGDIQIWQTHNKALVYTFENAQEAIFSPDSQLVAVKSDNGIQIFRISDGYLLRSMDSMSNVTFSPDSNYVICWSRSEMQVWKISQ